MDDTILLCTFTAELSLAVGYGLSSLEQLIKDGRAAVSAFCDLLEGYIPEDYERPEKSARGVNLPDGEKKQ